MQNNGTATIAGNLQAALTNAGTTQLALGTITGAVTNTRTGTMTGNGTIAGTLANAGTATIGGRVTGQVTNTGTLTSADTLRVAALNNTAKIILKDHIDHCLTDAVESGDQQAIDELNLAIEKFMT